MRWLPDLQPEALFLVHMLGLVLGSDRHHFWKGYTWLPSLVSSPNIAKGLDLTPVRAISCWFKSMMNPCCLTKGGMG